MKNITTNSGCLRSWRQLAPAPLALWWPSWRGAEPAARAGRLEARLVLPAERQCVHRCVAALFFVSSLPRLRSAHSLCSSRFLRSGSPQLRPVAT